MIDGRTWLAGTMPEITPVGELVAECDPATFVAVTTTFTVSPIRPVTRLSVDPVAFEISEHSLPAALQASH